MCYTMLCMLEWMRKRKYRRGILRTRGLRGSALTAYIHGGIPKGYIFIVWECSTITSYVTMNPNMSIYRRLNPRLLVQAGLGLGLLHWANICLIYISLTYSNTSENGLPYYRVHSENQWYAGKEEKKLKEEKRSGSCSMESYAYDPVLEAREKPLLPKKKKNCRSLAQER